MATSEPLEYTCTLSEETLELAKNELHEDPSTRLLEIRTLRDRLQQYPGLKSRLDPQFLVRFLRARKFDQERAFDLVLHYYRMRKEHPAIFDGLKPSNVTHVYNKYVHYPSSHRDRLGRQIYFHFPARATAGHFPLLDVVKMEFLNLNKIIEDEENQVRGFTFLADFEVFGMSNFTRMETEFARLLVQLWQDSIPVRVKNILLVNEPAVMDLLMAMVTPFTKDKIIRRIHRIGTDWKKLHEFIDPACLPARYGGTLDEEVDPQRWVDRMMECDREMEKEGKHGFVDYTLHPEQDQKEQDAFPHMVGTFKKLDHI